MLTNSNSHKFLLHYCIRDATSTISPGKLFVVMQVLLHLVLPGSMEEGVVLADKRRLQYKLTGVIFRQVKCEVNVAS